MTTIEFYFVCMPFAFIGGMLLSIEKDQLTWGSLIVGTLVAVIPVINWFGAILGVVIVIGLILGFIAELCKVPVFKDKINLKKD